MEDEMATYRIEAGAIDSTYEASDREHAILAYVRDAGYADVETAAKACGQSVEQFVADIRVTETPESRQAADWRKLIAFINDVTDEPQGDETTIRLGAESQLRIQANEDGTFTLHVEGIQ